MAGYPPVHFNIKGFSIKGLRAEDFCIVAVELNDNNPELSKIIYNHFKELPRTDDRNVVEECLKKAVNEYHNSLK